MSCLEQMLQQRRISFRLSGAESLEQEHDEERERGEFALWPGAQRAGVGPDGHRVLRKRAEDGVAAVATGGD
jgi:hypothetical protein